MSFNKLVIHRPHMDSKTAASRKIKEKEEKHSHPTEKQA